MLHVSREYPSFIKDANLYFTDIQWSQYRARGVTRWLGALAALAEP